MKLKPFESCVALVFAVGSALSFMDEHALRSGGTAVVGTVVSHEQGDMGSSCPIVRMTVNGKTMDWRTGECSNDPPRVGSPVSMLFDSERNEAMMDRKVRPAYLFAGLFALTAVVFGVMSWAGKNSG